MLDKDSLEKSLLLGVVRDRNWEVMILNNITIECFSYANHRLYKYIKNYVDEGRYPELRIIGNEFEIDDISMREYLEISDLNGLCEVLHNEYIRNQLEFKVGKLNEFSNELKENPVKYIDRIGEVYTSMRQISYHTKSVDLFDNLDEILSIDKSDVISSGFKELDEKLVGWKRGEELVVFMGRTGQGKSWLGLKFAMAAAEQGERVGIYSGEMSTQQLQERILCCAKQTYTSTREEAAEYIKSKNLFIKIITQKELRRRATVDDIEEFIIRDKLTMVIIDQLSLMEDNTSKPRNTVATTIW